MEMFRTHCWCRPLTDLSYSHTLQVNVDAVSRIRIHVLLSGPLDGLVGKAPACHVASLAESNSEDLHNW